MKQTVIERDVSSFVDKCEELIRCGFRFVNLRIMRPKQFNEEATEEDENGEKTIPDNIFSAEFEK